MTLRRSWRYFRGDSPALFGLLLVCVTLSFAVLAPVIWPHSPYESDFALPSSPLGGPPGPSLAHPLGTDALFRDLLARLASGASLSLGVAFAATAMAVTLGACVGLVAGMSWGTRLGWLDSALVRVIELALAFPYLLLITAVGVVLERATPTAIALLLGVTGWVGLARLVRTKTIELRASDHLLAARALGVPVSRLVWRHVLPSLRGVLLVVGSQSIGTMILAEAVLGYLTIGVGPPRASWGRMLQEAEPYLGVHPLLVAAPAFAILVAVFGFSRLADGFANATSTRAPAVSRSRVPVDLLVLAALLVAALGFSGNTELPPPLSERDNRDGVLRIATAHAVGPLDPALAYDELTLGVDELVHARLFRHEPDGTLVGELAESLVSTEGGLKLVVTLREAMKFHDGARLDAASVKRSLERALHPDTPCPAAEAFARIRGFERFRERQAPALEGLRVDGERTLVVELSEADPAFPSLLTLGFAAPVCDDRRSRADAGAPPPCGAGPFRLVRRDDERIELARFEGYGAREEGAPERLVLRLGLPARTQRYLFERGELDVLTEVSGVDAQRFDADPRWKDNMGWATRPSIEGVYLDTHAAPFDNRHLRRAVAFALNPEELSRARPSVAAIDRILPRGIPRPASVEGRRHDLRAALREMELAGYPFDPESKRGGYPYPVRYLTVGSSFDQAAAEIYVQQLAKIGLVVEIDAVPYATWLATVGTGSAPPMGWRGWIPDFPDPAGVVDPLLLSSALGVDQTQNVSFYTNAEVDRLAAEARREPDESRRMRHYAAIEEIVREEAPWIPCYTSRSFAAWHGFVREVRFDPTGRVRLDGVRLHLKREPLKQ